VCGFAEMKPVEYRYEIAARRCGIGGVSAAIGIVAGVVPSRCAAATPSMAEDALSATSTQGPQWEDEIGTAMADAA